MDLSEIAKNPEKIEKADPEEIPLLLAGLASIQSALTARLLISRQSIHPSNPEVKEDRLLDADQVAQILNLKKSKVYELAKQKEGVPPFFYIGKYPRISEAALRKWIAEKGDKSLDNSLIQWYSNGHVKRRTQKDQGRNGIDPRADGRPVRST